MERTNKKVYLSFFFLFVLSQLSTSMSICVYTGKPNILRWLTSSFSPKKSSSGVLLSSTQWGLRFYTYTIVLDSSSQRWIGKSWSCNIAFSTSMMIWFFHSVTPFYWGLYGVLNSLLIPESLQSSLNYFKVKSPPLSDCRVLIFLSV